MAPIEIKTTFELADSKQISIRRLNNQELKDIEIWPKFSPDEAPKKINNNIASYRQYLTNLSNSDLTKNIQYTNSKGEKFETAIRDILNHVLVHGGHHRGQIAKYIREAGGEPLNTDYITHIRNQ